MNIDKQKYLIDKRIDFIARSGKFFDKFPIFNKKNFGIGQKYSYHRVPDKIMHFAYDIILKIKYGKLINNTGNAFESLCSYGAKFEQHPLHRGFYYNSDTHSLVGTATGLDINVSNGKHHIIELNRAIGILEIIRPIYNTKYGPEIYNIVNFAKKYKFKKVYVMYSRLHLYRQEILDASKEFNLEMIPVSYPWVEFDKDTYKHYYMPKELEPETLYMRLEPGYSPIMHYLSDKYISYKWLNEVFEENPKDFNFVNIPKTTNYLRINSDNYSDKWPTTVIKQSGKMQGQGIFMLKAKSETDAMEFLNISTKEQTPPIFEARFTEKITDKLFGSGKTIIYQDFVPPALKNDMAGRIRINVFANPLETISLSDYYMWTVFKTPDKCPDGLIKQPEPYIVNWKYSGKKAQFVELTNEERKFTDAATPQICKLIHKGLEKKFVSEPPIND